MPDVRRWIEALEAKTVENGCTPAEAEAARVKVLELKAKHPQAAKAVVNRQRGRAAQARTWTVYDNPDDNWRYYPDVDVWVPPHTYGMVRPEGEPDRVRKLYVPERPWWKR